MSLHQGLDLSRFKKISSDKKTSTLRHAGGHEIKIAHSGMSPKMREHIEAMPVHLAEGGEAEAPDDTEEEAPEEPSEPEEAPQAEPAEEAPSDEQAPAAAPAPQAEPAAPAEDANTIVVEGHHAPPTAQQLNEDDAHFEDDIRKGHIKPETIQSLYGKQDTLGKIGTLFGILVSGVGSGLTGQPNAVLDMMQKQIQNDLEAQKASNNNAQNWYQLSLKHEMQKAEIKQKAIQNELTKAQTGAVPSQVAQTEAHTANMEQDTYGRALKNAENKAMIGVKLHLLGITDKLPDGPTKAKAQETYKNIVAPAIDTKIQQNNQLLSSQLQLKHAITQRDKAAKETGTAGPSLVDTNKIQQLEYNGTQNGALGLTGLRGATQSMTPQQAAAARDEAAQVNKNRLVYDNLSKAFVDLDKQAAGGKINTGNYRTYMDHLVGQLIQSGIPKDQAEHLAASSLPGPTDWGATRGTKAQQMHDQFQIAEQKTGNLKPFGLLPAFPPPPTLSKEGEVKKAKTGVLSAVKSGLKTVSGAMSANAAQPQYTEGQTGKAKNGTPVVYKGGRWVPQ